MGMANWQLNAYRKIVGKRNQSAVDSPKEGEGNSTDNTTTEEHTGRPTGAISDAGKERDGKSGSPNGSAAGGNNANAVSDMLAGAASGIQNDQTKRRQVAVLLNELGTEQAAAILKRLPPSMAEQLAHESLLMEQPGEQERQDVMSLFGFTRTTSTPSRPDGTTISKTQQSEGYDSEETAEGSMGSAPSTPSASGPSAATPSGSAPSGSAGQGMNTPPWSHAYDMLERAFGAKKADRILHKAVPEAGRMRFSFLEELDARQLGTLFSGESAWVVSLVVSQSRPEVAAEILKSLDDTARRDVVKRVANMDSVQPEIVERVSESLKNRWREIGTERAPESGGGVSALAEIMKHMGNESLLDAIRQDDPELAEAVREELYSIDMVLKVQDRQLADILANFDDHSIALILKGKTEEIRSKIMRNVSERRAHMVSEEYRDLGPQRRSDVDSVTHEFVAHLRKLADDGALLVDDSDDRYI